ncbi:MAG: TonB-dependent receptor [Verrucomicrobia bacterium]|nr:TonB-dependent receptor [Verrucomicrobiota bacterium]
MSYPTLVGGSTAARLRGLLALPVAAVLAAQNPTPPPPAEAESGAVRTLEAFEVTGSRVKRLDYETPSPVITYTAAAIDERGYSTLGEFVQSLSFNNALGNSEYTTGSFITSAATINPRGLGSNRVLTLINGRRTVPFGLTNSANGTPQSVFNFNSVPSAAIERVEFLKDGASAIYGSDAITGVYNIILKRNFTGSAIDFNVSNTLKHDSLNRRVSLFTGMATDRWDISASVSHQVRHANFIQDFGVTTTDYRHLGGRGASYLNTIQSPSYLFLTAAQATATGLGTAGGYYIIADGRPTSTPARSNFTYVGTGTAGIPNSSRYDPVKDTQLYPASESTSANFSLQRRLEGGMSAFAHFGYHRSRTYYEGTPPGYSTTIQGFTLPASNPYNPLGISLTNGTTPAFTFRAPGYRPKRQIANQAASGLLGLRGTAWRIWQWESGVSYGLNRTTRTTDLIRAADLQAALNGTTRDTAYNPFGPSDNPRLIPGLYTRSVGNDNDVDALAFDLSASAKLWQLPLRGAGELGVATGYEYREDSLDSNPDTTEYLGISGGVPFDGERHTHAVFLEISAPLQKWFELQLASRHEIYSDFGSTTKPKISGKLHLPANRFLHVLLRGSYSESFKAPDLGQLYQKQTGAITSGTVLDPLRPQDPARQMRAILGGNPDLKPEEGKVQYIGAVFEVPALRGLSFSADYFDIKIDNVISTLSINYLLSPEGLRQFPNAVVRDNSRENPGPVSFFYGISNNLGFQLYRGLDLGLRYLWRSPRLGSFRFSADVTNILKRGTDGGQGGGFSDATGRYFAPEWRSNLSLGWSRRTLSAAVTADIIGKYYNRGFTAVGWGENVYPVFTPSFTYRGWQRTTLTIGSNNVLDKRPPPNGYVILGFDDRAYSAGALGRTVFIRARREF